jgi:hypothetical protein
MPSGVPALSVVNKYSNKIIATYENYGFQGNGRVCYGGSIANGSPNLTVSDALFTSADVGKLILITSNASGAPTTRMRTTILSVQSATSVTLSTNCTLTTLNNGGAIVTYGSDDSAAFTALMADCATYQSSAVLPAGRPNASFTGMYVTSIGIIIPNGVTLEGEGRDYPLVQTPPVAGTTLMLIVSLSGNPFVKVGDRVNTLSSTTPPIYPMNAVLRNLNVDACNGAANAVMTYGRRAQVDNCLIWRGTANALYVTSQNSWIERCTIGQQNTGDCINVGAGDLKISECDIRQAGNGGHGVHIVNSSNVRVQGCHIYRAGGMDAISSSNQGDNIRIESSGTIGALSATSNIIIEGNHLDATYGPQVHIITTANPSELHSVSVIGNTIFNNGIPDNTLTAFQIDVNTGSVVHGLTFVGNCGVSNQNRTNAYKQMFNVNNSGTLTNWSARDNHFMNCNAIFTATAGNAIPDAGHAGNSICVGSTSTSNTPTYGDQSGSATFSGTGSQTAFTITHNLAGTPTVWDVTPASSAASGLYYVTASSTQLTVTFNTAPASGTNNVVLQWLAKL